MNRTLLTTLLAAALGALAACGKPTTVEVTAKEYGDKWPLAAQQATLSCTDGARLVTVDGMAYALNGKALSAGLPRPDSILKTPGILDLADFAERAGKLCP